MTNEERAAYNRKWRKTPKGIEYRKGAMLRRNASWKGVVTTHSKSQKHRYVDGVRIDQFGKGVDWGHRGYVRNGLHVGNYHL